MKEQINEYYKHYKGGLYELLYIFEPTVKEDLDSEFLASLIQIKNVFDARIDSEFPTPVTDLYFDSKEDTFYNFSENKLAFYSKVISQDMWIRNYDEFNGDVILNSKTIPRFRKVYMEVHV